MKSRAFSDSIRLVIQHYWQQVQRHKLLATLGMILPGLGNIFVFYIPPLLIGYLLEDIGNNATTTGWDVLPYILAITASWIIGEIIWRTVMHFLIKLQARGVEQLYISAMNYLIEKELSFFSDNFTGSLTKKTSDYAKNFENITDTLTFSVLSPLLPLPFVAVVLWSFSPWLVVALVTMLTLSCFILLPFIRRRQKLVEASEKASNVLSGHISDVISNMPVVHAFANERQEARLHQHNAADYAAKSKRSWDYQNLRIDILASPLFIMTNLLGLVLALTLSSGQGIGLAAVFVTFSYFATFTRVLWEFNEVYRNLERGVTEAAQFTELLLKDAAVNDIAAPDALRLGAGAIAFNNVTFAYTDVKGGEPLLENFDLAIKPGEKVGLVGHSGGGKTTLTKLLLRFMDIQAGNITIDGCDIAKVRQADLRSHIAYVPQEPLLFHRSLRENIAYGKPAATDREIVEAAKKAHAGEFIDTLPDGYDTLVGERGVKLSGGQRQRIAIARAILKDAPILVLDEATSALDSESERLIQTALGELMKNRTSIVIAHRLSTVQKMDRIVVLENGAIIENGSHTELLKKDGVYASLWRHQSGGFIEE